MSDMIDRQAAIDAICKVCANGDDYVDCVERRPESTFCDEIVALRKLPSAQPDADKYEYHYDHTDCIWYRPEARNRCPATCAQYRDGWNDAMNYIFRDGKGYRPYRRDKTYEE